MGETRNGGTGQAGRGCGRNKKWGKGLGNGGNKKWENGGWLGHARDSNEMLIGTPMGVIRCYACRRMPETERWDREAIVGVKGTPQKPNPRKMGMSIPIRIQLGEEKTADQEPDPAVVREYQPRRRVITQR